jgi:hypothetical protein
LPWQPPTSRPWTRKRFTSIVKLVQKQIKKTVADVSAASKAGDDN